MVAAVLVVEPDPRLRHMVAQCLHHEGFAPITAPNGRDALQLLRLGFPTRIILLNPTMPVMDGWMFRAEQLRDPAIAQIPVVVLSSSSAHGLAAAAVCRKPVDCDEVLAAVHALLRIPLRPAREGGEGSVRR